MKDLLAIIAELGIELHPDRINFIADKIETIDSVEHFALIKTVLGPSANKTIVSQFDVAWKNNKNISPQEVAAALRGASAAAIENEKRGKTEIVWTGPSTGQIPVRHTEQVLCEVINYAQRHLFIVSFVAYKIDSVIKAMRDAIGRNVQINLLLELSAIEGGHVSQDSIKMMKGLLPSANIYTWPSKAKRNTTPHIGAIHAKCAVADGELAFITSANLTSAAMERNIELGILIRGGKLPSELQKHLDSFIVAGIFEKAGT
ncbi:MAG: DISARM system phospholipase D-like protein DrmC [Treponema sp.]|nr:DISARM system phospholipase D-like protein DrmC [Treponema sp.]